MGGSGEVGRVVTEGLEGCCRWVVRDEEKEKKTECQGS